MAAVGPAYAAPAGWSSPQDLSDVFEVGVQEGYAFNHPDVDVSGGGNAVAVWQRDEQSVTPAVARQVWFAERPLGGVWSAPRLLGTGTDPHVAANGDATVVAWISGSNAVARVRRAGGDFSAARNFGAGSEPRAGVDDAGAVSVLWSGGGVDYGIRAARNTAAAGWTATKTISFSPTAQTPDLAVSGGGDAIATWKAQDGVRVSEFTSAGGWSAHHLVGPGGVRPSIAANDSGQVVLSWARPAPPDDPILASTDSIRALAGTIRGGFGVEAKLSDDILWDWYADEPLPTVAIGNGGDVVVAWNRSVSFQHDATIQVSTVKLPGGGWQYAKSISVPLYVPQPSIGVLPDGTAIVAWRGGNAAVRSSDQADVSPAIWGSPFALGDAGSDIYNPDVAVDDAGRVHVVWADLSRPRSRSEDHLLYMAVQATSLGLPGSTPAPLPAPPGLSAPSAGGTLAAGAALTPGARPATIPKTLPKPSVTTVVKRGTLYLKVSATLSKRFKGRTLVIQRRVGRKVLRLGALKVPASGRIAKLLALNAYSKVGPAGVKGISRVEIRITLAASAKARGVVSPFRMAAI